MAPVHTREREQRRGRDPAPPLPTRTPERHPAAPLRQEEWREIHHASPRTTKHYFHQGKPWDIIDPPLSLKPLTTREHKTRGEEELPRWRRHLPPIERLPPKPPMNLPIRPEARIDKEALRQDTRARLEAAA